MLLQQSAWTQDVTVAPGPSVADNRTRSLNVIMLIDLNEPTFDVIFKYLKWTVHSQRLLPDDSSQVGRVNAVLCT
jgi:hypothetical protein